jgi:hypothetical protein
MDIFPNITDWLGNPGYTGNGSTIHEQIQCYSLPYGAWGFASHILTYYTVICLFKGRRPSSPCFELSSSRAAMIWDVTLGGLAFLSTVTLASLTIVRCKNSWQFVLIAVWKLVLSVAITGMTVHAGIISVRGPNSPARTTALKRWRDDADWNHEADGDEMRLLPAEPDHQAQPTRPQENPYMKLLGWVLLYILGALVGFVGLMDLVRQNLYQIPVLQTVSIVFLSVFAGCTAMVVLVVVISAWKGNNSAVVAVGGGIAFVVWATVILTVLSALFSDWALAAMVGDLIGTPSDQNRAVYYSYWVFKRLPMASW